MSSSIDQLRAGIAACRVCVEAPEGPALPHEPRPVAVVSTTAKIRIIGQAPGTRVHGSGRPFTDPSGDRLREWLGMDETSFYDQNKLAITPMGFCFPGLDAKGSDLPPRRECEKTWHNEVDAVMPQVELCLLIGMYAQKRHLGKNADKTLTETVRHWRDIYDDEETRIGKARVLPLPHPSWRNNAWIKKYPWFGEELLPFLRERITELT